MRGTYPGISNSRPFEVRVSRQGEPEAGQISQQRHWSLISPSVRYIYIKLTGVNVHVTHIGLPPRPTYSTGHLLPALVFAGRRVSPA